MNADIKKELSYLLVFILLAIAGCSQEPAEFSMEIGGEQIMLEVADSRQERSQGLANRASLKTNQGMLFVFKVPTHTCFWMHETFIELDAAFISPDGELLAIATMEPETLEKHCSPAAASWVIELAGGWFAKHRLKAGDRLSVQNLQKLRKSLH